MSVRPIRRRGPTRRRLLKGAAALTASSALRPADAGSPPGQTDRTSSAPPSSAWHELVIPGGGFCRGLQVHSDGTMVTKVDVFGGYIGSTTEGTVWQQLWTSDRLPSNRFHGYTEYPMNRAPWSGGVGFTEIQMAPSNSSVLLCIMGTGNTGVPIVFYSRNKGVNWTVGDSRGITAGQHGTPQNSANTKAAIDPANEAFSYIGTVKELLYSTSYGATVTPISTLTIPAPSPGSYYAGIIFDRTSGTTTNYGVTVTNRVLIGVYGVGVYETTNGGVSWTARTGGIKEVATSSIAADGTTYWGDADGGLWRLTTGGAWTNITPRGAPYAMILCHPTIASIGWALSWTGSFNYCANLKAATPTWSGNCNHFLNSGGPGGSDAPWAQSAQESDLSCAYVQWDPKVAGRAWVSMGWGVMYADGITSIISSSQTIEWYSQFKGIENLVAQACNFSPNGGLYLSSWDLPLWYITRPSNAQSNYYPAAVRGNIVNNNASNDWAFGDPNFIIADIAGTIYYATDGGASGAWTSAGSGPSGSSWILLIALSSTTWLLHDYNPGGTIWITTNGGPSPTWTQLTGGALPSSTGWRFAWNGAPRAVCKDLVNAGTAYAYCGSTDSTHSGIWRTENYGSTWSHVYTGNFGAGSNDQGWFKLVAAPSNAGHLFASTGGNQATPGTLAPPRWSSPGVDLMRSTNGGATWVSCSNSHNTINVPWQVSLGAPKPGGGGYPSIYITCWMRTSATSGPFVWGMYRCDNGDQPIAHWTWTYLGIPNTQGGWLDLPMCSGADLNNWNRVVVGFSGSGWAHYGPNAI
jgi:hypothetical protein